MSTARYVFGVRPVITRVQHLARAILIWLAAFIMLLLSGTACATVRKSMPSPVPAIKQIPGGCVLQGGLHRPCPPTA